MKKIIIILISAFAFIYSCESNGVESELRKIAKADDSQINDSVKNEYKLDAYRLALRDMKKSDDNYLSEVEISKEYFDYYYNGLIHIYNESKIPETDSVVYLYPIHTFPIPRFNELVSSVNKDSEIYQKIINNEPTGIVEFDLIIDKYKFISNWKLEIGSHGYFNLWTDEINNLEAICNELEKFSFIEGADPNTPGGDGNDIESEIYEDRIYYKFVLGWGDCPAGCTAMRIWKFNVYFDGKVEFIESFGLPVYIRS